MTKKDYELIARILETNLEASKDSARATELAIELIHSFANDLAIENPRFDRDKFLAACGIEKTCTICDKQISVGDVHPECANDYVKNFYK